MRSYSGFRVWGSGFKDLRVLGFGVRDLRVWVGVERMMTPSWLSLTLVGSYP